MSDFESRREDARREEIDSRYPPEWVRCEACQGRGLIPGQWQPDDDNADICGRCDGAGEFIDR